MSAVPSTSAHELRLFGLGLTAAEAALVESLPAVLHAPTYDRLYRLGIHGDAITGRDAFDGLHVEPVVYLENERFELSRDLRDQSGSQLAIIIPVREDDRTVDMCAWELDTGTTATWRGAPLLGQDEIGAPHVAHEGVRVHPTPTEWLRAGRRGVVVLNPMHARWRLAEQKLIVRDAAFGRRLRDMLRLPQPNILVERMTGVAA